MFRTIRRFFEYIGAVIAYAKFLWNNYHDWDYGFFLCLIKFKLQRMERFFRSKHAWGVRSEATADEIKKAIDMADFLLVGEFMENEYDAYEIKWGSLEIEKGSNEIFNCRRPNIRTSKDKEQAAREYQDIARREQEAVSQAYKDLFIYIAKHIEDWWD